MDGLLRNYPGWPRLRTNTAANPTTPVPMLNSEAVEQIKKMQNTEKNHYYHRNPYRIPGISACEAALDECLRKYKIISRVIWVSSICMKEIIQDMEIRYQSRFNGYIPYLYGETAQIIKISVIVDPNVHEDHIICILD